MEKGTVTKPGTVPVRARVFQADDGTAAVNLEVTVGGTTLGIGLTSETARDLADQLVIQAQRVEELTTI